MDEREPGGAPEAERLVRRVRRELLSGLVLESVDPRDPVVIRRLPPPWERVGVGNYAAVLGHPEHPELVVKVYAPGRHGFEEEVEVYRRLGTHPAFSECFASGDGFLVLRRLHGETLYDCLRLGLPIPVQVIRDVDDALDYARRRGLHPHDVHGRNVMMWRGRGLVADVSDFLQEEDCTMWEDVRKAYFRIYRPLLLPLRMRFPGALLNLVRAGYRTFRRMVPRSS